MKKVMLLYLMCVYHHGILPTIIGSDDTVGRQARAFFKKETSFTNLMKGFSVFQNGFTLENPDTIASFDAFFPVAGDVVLNGGTLDLQGDIIFKSPFRIGVGNINGNDHTVELPRNVSVLDFPSVYYIKLIVNLLDSVFVGHEVYSIHWNTDDTYVAAALRGSPNNNELRILQFNGSSWTQVASQDFGVHTIYSVRWHPSQNYLATAASGGTELATWFFNTADDSLTQIDTADIGTCTALSWNSSGNYLAVGQSNKNQLAVYPVTAGSLGAAITGSLGSNVDVRNNALHWNGTGELLSCGLRKKNGSDSLRIFYFDTVSLVEQSSADINADVNAVAWMPSNNILAVGLSSGDQRLLLYSYANSTLTQLTSSYVNLEQTVWAAEWDPDGRYLAIGKEYSAQGYELEVYYFDEQGQTLHLVSGYSPDNHMRAVSWAHSGNYLVGGDDGQYVYSYDFRGVPFVFNDLKLFLGSKLITHASIYFKGNCIVNGNSNILSLKENTSLVVTSGSTLTLEDISIKGLDGTNIICQDETSHLILRNTTLSLDNDYSFTCGSMQFIDDVIFRGDFNYVYSSNQTSTIMEMSRLIFDSNLTFSYCPINGKNNLLEFESDTSQLVLDGANMVIDNSGLSLTKGKFYVTRNSQFEVASPASIDLGDGTQENDISCSILSGIELYLKSGCLNYRNVLETSWKKNTNTWLRIGNASILQLYTPLNIGEGTVRLEQDAMIKPTGTGGLIGRIFSAGIFNYVNG